MWPAIIGAAASIAGSAINNANSAGAADKSFARQKQLMAIQQQYAVDNWNRETNYNDPRQQMKRLKDAGLNPNLIYGNGAAGLEAPSVAAPTAPAAPMQVTAPGNFGSAVSDAVQAAVGIHQAEKAKSETTAQDIRNKYIESECVKALRNMDDTHELNQETKKQIIQSVQASQTEMDALKIRVGNESYDRLLATMNTFGTLERWQHQNNLDDEQKKWLGTHAMAAMLGARGSYAQATAMAEAIRLFRHPDEFKKVFKEWMSELGEELKSAFNGTIPQNLREAIEDLSNGEIFDGLFGRGSKEKVKGWFKPSDNTPPVPHLKR